MGRLFYYCHPACRKWIGKCYNISFEESKKGS